MSDYTLAGALCRVLIQSIVALAFSIGNTMFAMKTATALPFQPQRKYGLHVWRVHIYSVYSKASLLSSGVLSVSDLASPIRVPTHSSYSFVAKSGVGYQESVE